MCVNLLLKANMKLALPALAILLLTMASCGSRPLPSEPCVAMSHSNWQVIGDAEPPGPPRLFLSGEVILPDEGYKPVFVRRKSNLSGNAQTLILDLQFRSPVNLSNPKLTADPINPTQLKVSHRAQGKYQRIQLICGDLVLWENDIGYGL